MVALPPIEALPDADIAAACALFLQVYGHPTTPEVWRWKYGAGPRLGSVNLVARGPQGELLGHVGCTVFPGVQAGRTLAMAQVCDVMVLPGARGGLAADGVYPRLLAHLQGTLTQRFGSESLAYGFAGIRPFRLGQRLGVYRVLHESRVVAAPLRALPWYRRWGWRVQRVAWNADGVGPWLERLWQDHAPRQATPRVARTAAYLQWRYAGHPQHRYQLWRLQGFGGARGWCVTRDQPGGEQMLIDALWPGGLADEDWPALAAGAVPGAALRQWSRVPALTGSNADHPVIASEVRIDTWRDHYLRASLYPGDTDVY